VEAVCSGLGDYVEDSSAGASELGAKVTGLHRHFLDGVGDVEVAYWLSTSRLLNSAICTVVGLLKKVLLSSEQCKLDESSYARVQPETSMSIAMHACGAPTLT